MVMNDLKESTFFILFRWETISENVLPICNECNLRTNSQWFSQSLIFNSEITH